jgi:hypothetical protein
MMLSHNTSTRALQDGEKVWEKQLLSQMLVSRRKKLRR